MAWQIFRIASDEALALKSAKKLRAEEMLVTRYAGTSLRTELDRIPLWRGDHVSIKQLSEDFARYVYLPRLARPQLLLNAIVDGLGLLTWERETFAFADSYDVETGRYRGLRYGKAVMLADSSVGLLVKPEAARRQIDAEAAAAAASGGTTQPTSGNGESKSSQRTVPGEKVAEPAAQPKRFHGTADLDPTRVGRDAGRIADEVISHLAGLVSSRVKVTLEIEAEIPNGAPDNVVRTVTENARTLKFTSQGFEKE